MKKIIRLLTITASILFLTACGGGNELSTESKDTNSSNTTSEISNTSVSSDKSEIKESSTSGEIVYTEPILKFWQVTNYQSIPLFCYLFENTVNADVSFTFNVTYYKNKEVVGHGEDLSFVCVGPLAEAFGFDNWNVPEQVDDISIEITFVGASFYKSVPVKETKTALVNEGDLELKVNVDFLDSANYEEADTYTVIFDNKNNIAMCWAESFFEGETVEIHIPYYEGTYATYSVYVTCFARI